MDGYVLRVVSSDDHDKDADQSISEAVMSDLGLLFREICRNIVKGELRLQGDVPEALYSGIEIEGDSSLAADARRMLHETLAYLGGAADGTFMSDTFPDIIGRKAVASAVLRVHDSLCGHVLLHGPEDDVKCFGDMDVLRVTEMARMATRAHNGGIMGVIVKDPKRRDHYAITSGKGLIPLNYVPTVPSYDREDFASAGPVIAMGTIVRDDDDNIVEIKAVDNCYTFPGTVFLRGISAFGDIGLVYPLEGIPSYYARTATWYLRCEDLGLDASAKCWDDCVMEFHRQFVSLWMSHRDGSAPDNPRIHEMLDTMCPFDPSEDGEG